jgi:dienelactone hydrolase
VNPHKELEPPLAPGDGRSRRLGASISVKAWIACFGLALALGATLLPSRVRDTVTIVAGRARDSIAAKLQSPLYRERHQHVVDRAIEQGDQIAAYLEAQRSAAPEHALIDALDFSSQGAYLRSSAALRARLGASLRFPPPGFEQKPTALAVETRVGEDDIAVYRELRIPVLPGVESVGLYMRPKNAREQDRLPLVIAAPGRGGMPSPTSDGGLPTVIRSSRDLSWDALQHGFAVWVPTFVHYGRDSDDFRDRLTVRAWEANTSLPAIEIAKITRAIDALSQRNDIDADRIAMVGHSYGGFYTLYATALEPRIRVAVVSAYFNDREAVLEASEPGGFLDWRYPESLSLWRDPAVAALVAPRPLLIEAGTQDQLFPIEGARRAAPQAAQFYARQGLAERFHFLEFAGRHDFEGPAAIAFIEKHLPPATRRTTTREEPSD